MNRISEDINELANEVMEGIRTLDSNLTVHVMGEMTFTYAVVSRLKA
ncbi:MAG: hypothetical protein IJJ68_08535 [Prevotella sp.]|nr:hypothetical protein [Prevotella sp.]